MAATAIEGNTSPGSSSSMSKEVELPLSLGPTTDSLESVVQATATASADASNVPGAETEAGLDAGSGVSAATATVASADSVASNAPASLQEMIKKAIESTDADGAVGKGNLILAGSSIKISEGKREGSGGAGGLNNDGENMSSSSRVFKVKGGATYTDYSMKLENSVSAILSAGEASRDPTFPVKLHQILSARDFEDIISWLPHGRSFRVLQPKAFEERVIPLFFRHGRYASFARQVNGWGFKRVCNGPDYGAYYHELFLRGLPKLAGQMRRPAPPGKNSTQKKGRKESTGEQAPNFYEISEKFPLPDLLRHDEVIGQQNAPSSNFGMANNSNAINSILGAGSAGMMPAPMSSLAGTSSNTFMPGPGGIHSGLGGLQLPLSLQLQMQQQIGNINTQMSQPPGHGIGGSQITDSSHQQALLQQVMLGGFQGGMLQPNSLLMLQGNANSAPIPSGVGLNMMLSGMGMPYGPSSTGMAPTQADARSSNGSNHTM